MYRLFVAIDLPENVKKELSGISYGMPGARWVPEEQLHLTLRFIGEVDGGVFRDIQEALGDIKSESFEIRIKGVGFFPPRKTPRVLWVGVEPHDKVSLLRKRVEGTLVRLGIEPEHRKFSPHITLARLQDTSLSKVTRFLAGHNLFASELFPVNEFILYSSTLTPKGAIHRQEAVYPLS